MHHYQTLATALALVSIVSSEIAPAQETADEVNQAQRLVFLGDHLQQLTEGQTVVYAFTRHASGEPDRQDEIKMTVDKVRDDSLRNLSFQFLSGSDQIDFPSAQGYRGNPIAIQFLERDIRDMAQATGTSTAYFRNRIRNAFKDPQIEQTRTTVGETEVDAVEISVTPFQKDPNVSQMAGYAEKQYRFAYSEQIPGHLISVQTRMSNGGDAFLEEEIRYTGVVETLTAGNTSAAAAGQ
jgi:hypothetical protein